MWIIVSLMAAVHVPRQKDSRLLRSLNRFFNNEIPRWRYRVGNELRDCHTSRGYVWRDVERPFEVAAGSCCLPIVHTHGPLGNKIRDGIHRDCHCSKRLIGKTMIERRVSPNQWFSPLFFFLLLLLFFLISFIRFTIVTSIVCNFFYRTNWGYVLERLRELKDFI